jgi:hypothetical protein
MKVSENTALLWGIGIVAGGGLITLSTYNNAGPGGSYVGPRDYFS